MYYIIHIALFTYVCICNLCTFKLGLENIYKNYMYIPIAT